MSDDPQQPIDVSRPETSTGASPPAIGPKSPMPAPTKPKSVVAVLLSSAVGGAIFGGLAGMACCWLAGKSDNLLSGGAWGSGFGAIAGAAFGGIERWRRNEIARSDRFSTIGFVIGFVPGCLLFLGGAGSVFGSMSIYVLIGLIFIGPMIGLVLGGLLDRSQEAWRYRTIREAVCCLCLAIGGVAALSWLMISNPFEPDIKTLTRQVRGIMVEKWREEFGEKAVSVDSIELKRVRDGTYAGIVDATIQKVREQFHVEATVTGDVISARWWPIEEVAPPKN
jgi:hypothetical protein